MENTLVTLSYITSAAENNRKSFSSAFIPRLSNVRSKKSVKKKTSIIIVLLLTMYNIEFSIQQHDLLSLGVTLLLFLLNMLH